MPSLTTESGVLVTYPDGVTVDAARPDAASSRRGGAVESTDAVRDGLLNGLRQQGLVFTDTLTVTPTATSGRRTVRQDEPVRIEVPGDQASLLLVEQDGLFAWSLPSADTLRRRGRSATEPARFVVGAIVQATDGERRSSIGGSIASQLIEPVRVYVVRIAARWLVSAARRRLEEAVEPGLVRVAGDDPAQWRPWPTDALRRLAPLETASRSLLLLHGCFSSTAGSFGALAATPWGRELLTKLHKSYGLVLGYDHPTLSASPEENARDLLGALQASSPGAMDELDIVAFSRGGLVGQALMRLGVKVRRAVFVCSPLAGTPLAEPTAWHRLLDVSTNLAVAAGRSVALAGLPTTSAIVAESVKTLGALARAILEEGVREDQVPGLAAMRPGKPMQHGVAAPPIEGCYAITSDFDASKLPEENTALRRLAFASVGTAVRGVIGEPNDLVVPCASAIQDAGGRALSGVFRWGPNGVVYHTVAFLQPGLSSALSTWLLGETEGRPGGFEKPVAWLQAESEIGSLSGAAWVTSAHAAAPVVVQRDFGGKQFYYTRRVGDLTAALRDGDSLNRTFAEVLGLYDSDAALLGAITAEEGLGTSGAVFIGPRKRLLGVAAAPVPPALLRSGEIEPLSMAGRRRGQMLSPESYEQAASPALPETRGRSAKKNAGVLPSSSTRRKVQGRSAATRDSVITPNEAVELHVTAQIAEQPIFGRRAKVDVTVSREAVETVVGRLNATERGTAVQGTPLTLIIQARTNCKVAGEAQLDAIGLPNPQKPDIFGFDIEALNPGPAEFWVDALQGGRRLVRLVLQPTFIAPDRILTASAPASPRFEDPPLAELRIFEFGDCLYFTLQCRELDLRVEGRTPVPGRTKDDFIESLYKTLEGEWGEDSAQFGNFMSKIRAFGTKLYTELMPLELREKLWKYRDKIGSIEVVSQEPFIPWELACLAAPDEDAAPTDEPFLAELGLVRWIGNQGFAPATLRLRPGMARYVIPDYATERWQLEAASAEMAFLEEQMKAQPVTPNAQAVEDILGRGDSFDLIHFACHGEADPDRIWEAALLLEGRMKRGTYVPESLNAVQIERSARLRQSDRGRPMVFLNACQAGKSGRSLGGTGGMAKAFVSRGAGLFVGTQWSVGDVTALTFAKTFYGRLQASDTLAVAVRAAREAAKRAREPTWLAYTVYGHPYARLSTA